MILHIDMDAFFASVEQLDCPELKGKCVIVGGISGRGVVSAASYEARKFGVRSAMPVFQARRLCPQGVFLPPRFHRYREISERVFSLLRDVSPLVEPVSIDEAYVDISGCGRLFGPPERIAARIKERIRETVHLTCSIGVAPNKFLAKIASELRKPDGFAMIPPEEVSDFVFSLPVEKVPGVGKATGERLSLLGIKTLGDVRKFPEAWLKHKFGSFGERLSELSKGIDHSPVEPEGKPKSVSSEGTLQTDTADKEILRLHLLGHAEDVARELRKLRVRARTVTLKVKHADFRQFTRSRSLAAPTQSTEVLFSTAATLLAEYPLSGRVRLVGLGASGLVPEETPLQMGLFCGGEEKDKNWEKVDRALDSITEKFGRSSVQRASLAPEPEPAKD